MGYIILISEETNILVSYRVFDLYNKADFIIKWIHVDPEFEFMKDTMKQLDIELSLNKDSDDQKPDVNVMAAQEHVSDIEIAIIVIKERYRCLWHQLPFKAMPRIMIQEAAKHKSSRK